MRQCVTLTFGQHRADLIVALAALLALLARCGALVAGVATLEVENAALDQQTKHTTFYAYSEARASPCMLSP